MVPFRRGFKSAASQIAREVRAELGLVLSSPLDVFELAEHLGIPLLPLSSLRAVEPDAVQHFLSVDTGAFSAGTVFDGPRSMVLYNDGHARTRQASDISHEIAHALLRHVPQPALDAIGCRVWSTDMEQEADWLGGALLVSDEAALYIARVGLLLHEAADQYGVSVQMMRFRLNVTGAAKRTRPPGH